MQWKTALTNIHDDKTTIRGRALKTLTEKHTFVEAIFLLLIGRMPKPRETRMLNAMLTAAIDHGIGTASTMTARIVASAKNSLHTAVAAGILAMGDLHGGAIEGAGKFFQEHKNEKDIDAVVKSYREHGLRIPGYGHAVLLRDERTETLFAIAKKEKFFKAHCTFADAVGKRLSAHASKALPLNIDGALAAILSDMGFDWRMMKGIFLIARVPGLVAHVYEEMTAGSGLRRLALEDIVYTRGE